MSMLPLFNPANKKKPSPLDNKHEQAERKARQLVKIYGYAKALELSLAETRILDNSNWPKKQFYKAVVREIQQLQRDNNLWELQDLIKDAEDE